MDLKAIVKEHGLVGFDDVFWNLGQVLAWVETRSPFAVDVLSDSTQALAQREHSLPSGLPGFASEIAEQRAKDGGVSQRPSPFGSLDDVRRTVLHAFQSGELVATGHRRGTVGRQEIPKLEWADLVMSDNADGEILVHYPASSSTEWRDVRVPQASVVAIFPVVSAQQSTPGPLMIGDPPRYVPEWETLNEALLRLISGGMSEKDAKRALSSAIAESHIAVRADIDELFQTAFYSVRPPDRLLPSDFVWDQSRPTDAWYCDYGLDSGFYPIEVLELDMRDMVALFPACFGSANEPSAPGIQVIERDKGGRPREYDWDAIKEFALGLVTQHGKPGRDNRVLPTKAQLVEAILNEWQTKKGIELAEPTVRRYVGAWLGRL